MSKSREQLNEYLKHINIEGKKVLDVGVQDKPAARLCQGIASEYWTLDIDPQWKPDIVGDLNKPDLTLSRGFIGKHPNVVFALEVLEHCWNPVVAVENIFKMLTFGGVAYISTPFINPHHDYVDYCRYTGEWYEKVLHEVGFAEVTVQERVATVGKPLLEGFFRAEGLRVSKIRPEFGKYTYPIGYFVTAKVGSYD